MAPLELKIEGEGPETLFFVHGWPDNASAWDAQVEHFRGRYRCARVTLPCCGDQHNEPSMDFPDLARAIAAAIERAQAGRPDPGVILFGHDWGAALACLVERDRPDLVKKLITFDVGGHIQPRTKAEALFFLGYTTLLASAWAAQRAVPIAGRAVANLASRAFARWCHAPRVDAVDARMNYFYVYLWRSKLLPWFRKGQLGRYTPHRPTLFIYGAKKPFLFHSKRWEGLVLATPGGRVEVIPQGDHWFHLREAAETNRRIESWLQA